MPVQAYTSGDNSSLPRLPLNQDKPVSLVTQALGGSELMYLRCFQYADRSIVSTHDNLGRLRETEKNRDAYLLVLFARESGRAIPKQKIEAAPRNPQRNLILACYVLLS